MLDAVLAEVEAYRPQIHGWCKPEKAAALVETILSRRFTTCVEIGVFGGSSLIPQALALKALGAGKIIGIDPWTTDAVLEDMQNKDHVDWWSKCDLESIYASCCGFVGSTGTTPYVELIRDKAENVYQRFADESIDLLHIDGNHSEALAYKDATLYLPKVKPGGIIFFDDIYWHDGGDEPATRKAIVFLQQHCTKLNLVHDCMLLQKN